MKNNDIKTIKEYIGCPMIQGRVKRNTFSEVILKSKKKLASWKVGFLSKTGKIV